jgi:hypothetical protein
MASFFIEKVKRIKSATSSALDGRCSDPLASDVPHVGPCMETFVPVSEDEVERLLATMSAKSSPLDFIPTSLLKSCSSTFAVIIARLANLSFGQSTFPARFKTAQITPLLKKQGMDDSEPSSYRPISNLNTVSKVLERLVLARIVPHVSSSPSFDSMQSAYRKGHSTETALNKITNDVYSGLDTRQSTVLVALDQSAAFDCIDHWTLINRLRQTFGIRGNALDWLSSYLHGRSSFVRYNNVSSATSPVDTGIAQGSSLGPFLFSVYISPLASVVRSLGVRHHQYADDTQIYIAATKEDLSSRIGLLEQCTNRVHSWLLQNGLQLNPLKSEAIQFTASRGRQQGDDVTSVTVSDTSIQTAMTVKSLGVTFDNHLTFDQHVTSVCKSCYFHIRALRHVRNSLPDEVAKTVACSVVGTRLDYCNSLFVGMSASNFAKLQRVQNSLARTVLKRTRVASATSALIELHWLPVEYRVTFKLSTLTFSVLNTGRPEYLRELLNVYKPARTLRSSSKDLLSVDRTRTVISTRSFHHSAATTWNSLPLEIRNCQTLLTFKRRLKTYLFNLAFTT